MSDSLIALDPIRVARDFINGYTTETDLYLHPPQAKWLVKLLDEAIELIIIADRRKVEARQP